MTISTVETIDSVRIGLGAEGRSYRELLIGVAKRYGLMLTICALLVSTAWFLPDSIGTNGRLAIAITGLAIVGWALSPLPDSIVAIAAALALVITGVLPEKKLFETLGSELVWLLVASFVIAAVVKTSGLMERIAFAAVRPFASVGAFFHAIAFVIALTAFVIPSTSGRAALLLPVFMALVDRMPGKHSERALALLFPTIILLSAGGSLIGAGAHFIAVESIQRTTGVTIGYFTWMKLTMPLTLLASHAAVVLITVLFVPRSERQIALPRHAEKGTPLSSQETRIVWALVGTIALWITTSWHGINIAVIACCGAILLMTNLFTKETPKQVFRNVNVELLIFLATTVAIADGVILSGASKWMAEGAMALLPDGATRSLPLTVVFLTVIAVLAHLVINSRSARAAVLIPALTLPAVGFGHDATVLVLVTVLGTGFSQTLMASAKPVAIFGNAGRETFTQSDLYRLALPLLPVKALLIIVFALFVWPHLMSQNHSSVNQSEITKQVPSLTAERTAIVENSSPYMEGTLCTRRQLRTVMVATIRDNKMWSSGWWHVWNKLTLDGFRVDRNAVKSIYRSEDMVRLRSYSTRLLGSNVIHSAIESAKASCLTETMSA